MNEEKAAALAEQLIDLQNHVIELRADIALHKNRADACDRLCVELQRRNTVLQKYMDDSVGYRP
jgi:hypothetical protein